MTAVRIRLAHQFPLPADDVFGALVDWPGHADWVPLTRVHVETGDGGPGTVFVAVSGVGAAALPDRMRVDSVDVDARHVVVTKIGPVLTGVVTLAVEETGPTSCRLDWDENIDVPRLPRVLARPVAAAARVGFAVALTRLQARLQATGTAGPR